MSEVSENFGLMRLIFFLSLLLVFWELASVAVCLIRLGAPGTAALSGGSFRFLLSEGLVLTFSSSIFSRSFSFDHFPHVLRKPSAQKENRGVSVDS